jgi:hypothetical protein
VYFDLATTVSATSEASPEVTPKTSPAPSHPTKSPSRTTPTDPNAPKRACSAFLLFSKAERPNVKRAHPNASNAEISKHLGDLWKAADAETKARYTALYTENKARADEDRRVYADSMKAESSASIDSGPTSPAVQTTRPKKTKRADPVRSSPLFTGASNQDGSILPSAWKSVLDASINLPVEE